MATSPDSTKIYATFTSPGPGSLQSGVVAIRSVTVYGVPLLWAALNGIVLQMPASLERP